MRIRTLLAGVLAIGAGLWWFAPQAEEPGIDPIVSASIRNPDHQEYTVSNMENRTACMITRGRSVTTRSHEVAIDKDCESVWPGLTAVRNWTQNDDGTVILTDSRGEQILTLGLGDGVDFESLEPANAVLALTIVQ